MLRTDHKAYVGKACIRKSAQNIIQEWSAYGDHGFDSSAGGRIVSVLEGGYDLQGLQESVAAHVTALMGA